MFAFYFKEWGKEWSLPATCRNMSTRVKIGKPHTISCVYLLEKYLGVNCLCKNEDIILCTVTCVSVGQGIILGCEPAVLMFVFIQLM